MKQIILALFLSNCYQRISMQSEPTYTGPEINILEDCIYSCGWDGVQPIGCRGKKRVIKHLECNIVNETYYSKWRNPKECKTTQNICTWNYLMEGRCAKYQ